MSGGAGVAFGGFGAAGPAGVQVEETALPSGWTAVRLRNQQVEVEVLPGKGAEIYRWVARRHRAPQDSSAVTGTSPTGPTGRSGRGSAAGGPSAAGAGAEGLDVLWKSPWGLRPPPVPGTWGPESQTVWMDYYAGGWQELFPNASTHGTVQGAAHTFHGEASVVPWQYRIERPGPGASTSGAGAPAGAGSAGGVPVLHLWVRLARSPFRIERRMWLDAERPVLRIWERITNEGAQAHPYVWGHHPAYGAPFLSGACRLDVPAGTYHAGAAQQPPPRGWLEPGRRSDWPHAARASGAPGAAGAGAGGVGSDATVDMRRIPGPEHHVTNFGFLAGLREGWYALSNPALGLGVALAWPVEVFPCIWLWQELGGSQGYPWWGNSYVMGVEPHTTFPADGLEALAAAGAAPTLGPGESREMTLAAAQFEPRGTVRRVTPEGEVEFEN